MRDGIAWSNDLLTLAARFAGRVAVTDGVATMDYATLSARAHALAHRLRAAGQHAAGLHPGTPVATLVPNGIDAPWVSCGVTIAGAAEVAVNAHSTDAEILWYAELAGFRRILAPAAQAARLAALGLDPWPIEDVAPDPGAPALPPVPEDAWGRIIFTSGTTGRPKAIVHTHGGRWTAHLLQRAVLPFTPGEGDRVLLMTPFVHGASLITAAWLEQGAEVVLQDGVRADRLASVMEGTPPAAIFAPPTVLAKLLSLYPGRRFEGVRVIFCGTATLTRDLWQRAADAFGPVVRVTYGMSECFNPITVLEPAEVQAAMAEADDGLGAHLGWPAPGVEVSIRGEDGAALPHGEPGEIFLRARHMTAGTITAAGFAARPAGGWHRTGDLGAIDARGRLRLSGRAADLMKTGGYRVHPAEIEAALDGAAGGQAICVLGIPSDYWGEVVVAVAETPPSGWEDAARERLSVLARAKHPRAFIALPELPRNAQGKVVRARVREAVLAGHVLEDGPHPRLAARGPT
ncbi:class I adenylate-forming enzyme family protein [Neoroseomonas rubea]|uniref:class I adenylate-forming enzyme family protein n=1 Tax=Neoroseomonas rubea TaxID=2748666 RepID=UPI0018DFCC71|nr:class I adenylate-forming enzyme family protein [Roseomonas rubea]